MFFCHDILLIQIVIYVNVTAPLRIFFYWDHIPSKPTAFSFPFYSKFSRFARRVCFFLVSRLISNLLGAISMVLRIDCVPFITACSFFKLFWLTCWKCFPIYYETDWKNGRNSEYHVPAWPTCCTFCAPIHTISAPLAQGCCLLWTLILIVHSSDFWNLNFISVWTRCIWILFPEIF